MAKLEGKVALITGGDSGIGLATARRFVAEGASVYLTGRRQRALDAAVLDIDQSMSRHLKLVTNDRRLSASRRAVPQGCLLRTDLRNAGAEWVDDEFVVDRNLASSRKPDAIPASTGTARGALRRDGSVHPLAPGRELRAVAEEAA